MIAHIGEFAALGVAVVWTITAMAFEQASNKIGSLNVNLLRLPIAFLLLCFFTFLTRGHALPADATSHHWFWLTLSGLVGYVIGDLFLFKAFTYIGSRFSMLLMTIVPPVAAFISWIVFHESLTIYSFLGMVLTLGGIALAVNSHKDKATNQFSKKSILGIIFAVGGALGQAGGLILSKVGMQNYNPFASSQIRIIAGIIGFTLIIIFMGRLKGLLPALKNKSGMKALFIGAFFGPFIGVSLSLFSIQHTNAGIASTIMSIVPILIIIPSVYMFKQKVTFAEVVGAILSVAGVALFFV
jgi:drug/metabolite transporter (DMT)-like permease